MPQEAKITAETPIEVLELSVRSYNGLVRAEIKTVGELAKKTDAELLRIKNFGRKSLREVRELLELYRQPGPIQPPPEVPSFAQLLATLSPKVEVVMDRQAKDAKLRIKSPGTTQSEDR